MLLQDTLNRSAGRAGQATSASGHTGITGEPAVAPSTSISTKRRSANTVHGPSSTCENYSLDYWMIPPVFLAILCAGKVHAGPGIGHFSDDSLFRMSGSTIMDITHGFDVQDEEDPFLILAECAADAAVQSYNAGSYLGASTASLQLNRTNLSYIS